MSDLNLFPTHLPARRERQSWTDPLGVYKPIACGVPGRARRPRRHSIKPTNDVSHDGFVFPYLPGGHRGSAHRVHISSRISYVARLAGSCTCDGAGLPGLWQSCSTRRPSRTCAVPRLDAWCTGTPAALIRATPPRSARLDADRSIARGRLPARSSRRLTCVGAEAYVAQARVRPPPRSCCT